MGYGLTESQKNLLKSLPYDSALNTVWMWMRDNVINERSDFKDAICLIESTARARAACSALGD